MSCRASTCPSPHAASSSDRLATSDAIAAAAAAAVAPAVAPAPAPAAPPAAVAPELYSAMRAHRWAWRTANAHPADKTAKRSRKSQQTRPPDKSTPLETLYGEVVEEK